MRFVELGLLPACALVALAGLVAYRGLRRRRSARACAVLLAVTLDVLLWLWASTPPIGPDLPLALVLVLVHAGLVLTLVERATGLHLRSGRSVSGRYQKVNSGRGSYDGYRAD